MVLFLVFLLLPMQKVSAQTANTGFVQANLWYSKDPFEEGDKIKVYTLIFNPDTKELSGTVNFFDNSVLLGKKVFTVAGGATNAISINWTATAGDHVIFGQIENPKFLLPNGNYQTISLAQNQTTKSSRTVAKKIIPGTTDETSGIVNILPGGISDITKTIENNIPDSVSKAIVLGASTVENFRQNISTASDNKQKEIKNDIKALDKTKTETAAQDDAMQDTFLKPFKYAELFFLSVFSYIVNNKILFYGISIIIIFSILRYIWVKFF